MADLFEEIEEDMERFRAQQRIRRRMRWAEDRFFRRRPWRWVPERLTWARVILFRLFGVPPEAWLTEEGPDG